jgi:uncharacterized protein YdhG (YjbR/CyaY superfamily)
MTTPSTIDDYLADLPEDVRAALEQLRRTIKASAPDTTETISYQMPTFKYRGRALVGFAAFKHHCSLFPYSRTVLHVLEHELKSYDTSGKGGTIRFTIDKPLPAALVKRIVRTRMEEIDAPG